VPARHRVEDFAQAIRAIGEPIHSRTADQISMAKLLTLLFEITALFDMATRIELVLLQKTMVVVEGVARKLDPRLNMWATAEPVVGSWIAENLGPRGKIEDIARNLSVLAKVAGDAPLRLERIGRLIDRWEEAAAAGELFGGLEQIALRDERRLAVLPMVTLIVIAALLAIIAYRM
jgi:ubiquinone biosynthesis protein